MAVKRKIRKKAAKPTKNHSVGLLDYGDLSFLATAIRTLQQGFSKLPPVDTEAPSVARMDKILQRTAERLKNNYPYFHPLYAGQMLKPPHPIAQLAYSLAMTINPNNHALDGGRATSAMEKEAVAEIAAMFGWHKFLGHLCGGGTIANLEALWIAAQLAPGKTILASSQAHYTHARLTKALQLPFETIECDSSGRISVSALENRLTQGGIGTVVATMGTTATGSVDPLHEIVKLRAKHNFRIHADAAYGGYFVLARYLRDDTQSAFAAITEADSIAIDPHKHGLQPYGCGCILFKDPTVGQFYKHKSPYTYFTSTELHLGEISLECSRPGAVAAALWATQQLLPLKKGGEFAAGLEKSLQAASKLFSRLLKDPRFVVPLTPELDVVIFALQADSVSKASKLSRQLFDVAANRDLHLALVELPLHLWPDAPSTMRRDRETITCLRSALMKPEHLAWGDQIWQRLQSAATKVLA